jgi:AcrR family transcriptional regulator
MKNVSLPALNGARGRGRPRDGRKDKAVRAAVRKSLIKNGYQGTTIPVVARLAGVGPPTVYRRWPTQADLIATVFEEMSENPEPVKSDFRAYIRWLVEGTFRIIGDPATRIAVPGLLVEYQQDPARYAQLVASIETSERVEFRQVHAKAVRAGLAASQPTSDTLFDMIIGASIYLAVLRDETDDQTVDRITKMVLAAAKASSR